MKIFKISYYIISEVLKNEMTKRIEVRCTSTTRINLRRNLNLDLGSAAWGSTSNAFTKIACITAQYILFTG
jgi:hypothetical protein